MRIPCPVSENAQKFPDADALIWGRRSISWAVLDAYVHSTARHLKEIGIHPGSRLAIISPTSVEYVITLLALWRVGACVLPLSPHLPHPVRDDVLAEFRPCMVLLSSSEKPKIAGIRAFPLNMMVAYESMDVFLGKEEHLSPQVDLNLEAAVVLTSGSTGKPKGALLTYRNFFKNALGANDLIPFVPGDRWLLSLPLWHVSGLGVVFRALAGGGAIAVPTEEILGESIPRYQPTHLSVVPSQLRALLADSTTVASLTMAKCVLLGGGAIPHALAVEAVNWGVPLFATYGLTETASQVATGRIMPNGQMDIQVLPEGEVRISAQGEVQVRGPVVFKGYMFGGEGETFDQEGWFSTGDMGTIEHDQLRITGRRDNMFVSGGENVHPEAIEKVLMEHPSVEQALVVPVPDERFDLCPAAFIKFYLSEPVPEDELRSFLKDRLVRPERPREYYSWPEWAQGLKPERKDFERSITNKEFMPLY